MLKCSIQNKNDVIVKIVEKAEDNSQALSFVSTRRFTESLLPIFTKKIDKKTTKEQKQKFKQVADKLLEVPKKKRITSNYNLS